MITHADIRHTRHLHPSPEVSKVYDATTPRHTYQRTIPNPCSVLPGSDPTGTAIIDFGQQTSPFTWPAVNVTAGTYTFFSQPQFPLTPFCARWTMGLPDSDRSFPRSQALRSVSPSVIPPVRSPRARPSPSTAEVRPSAQTPLACSHY